MLSAMRACLPWLWRPCGCLGAAAQLPPPAGPDALLQSVKAAARGP